MSTKEATGVIDAALRLLKAASKQGPTGDAGTAEDTTNSYRAALVAALTAWLTENADLDLSNRFEVIRRLELLADELQEVAAEYLPQAFRMGFGPEAMDELDEVMLGEALVRNRDFLIMSLIPYLESELEEPPEPGVLLSDVALEREFAWITRVGLYTGAFWTTIWLGRESNLRKRGEVDTLPTRRLLDPRADHCGTCPPKAGEYGSWNEMLAFTGGLPADGSDDCHSNCRCQIEVLIDGEWVGVA